MGRFLVVVVILVALALLANKYLLGKGDVPPADGNVTASADDKGDAPAETRPADDSGAAKPPVTPQEKAAAEAVPSADVATDLQQQAGVEPKLAAAEQAQIEEILTPETIRTLEEHGFNIRQDVKERLERERELDKEVAKLLTPEERSKLGKIKLQPPDITTMVPKEEVALGDSSLTAGIPGEGDDLTGEQIHKWLSNPKNHVILKPELPLGLKAGEGEIKGLEENPLTRAKIELGRQLFFDPRLSKDFSISCASCHDPEFGYAHETRFGVGVGAQEGNRNSPVAYNRILSAAQFWDGRAATLEEQAKGPIANPIEMSNTHEACVDCLNGIPGYVVQFKAVFKDGLNIDNAAKAIASFERTLVTGPAPWDYYQELKSFTDAYGSTEEDLEILKEDEPETYEEYTKLKAAADKHPLSESARRGGELFFSDKSGCTACHLGANFTDEKYHNLGVGMDVPEPDLGRFVVTNEDKDRGAFKTPTVRNVAMTAPYMHDGSQGTLEEVVEWYVKGGHPNQWLDENIKKLDLTDQDKADLVAFMKEGLTGELPKVESGRLPPGGEQAQEEEQSIEEVKEQAREEAAAAN